MRTARVLLIAALVAVGCSRAPQDRPNLQPQVAAFGYYGVLEAQAKPAPKPAPGGKCANCNGKGSVSDGRVSVKCPVCDGRGVVSGSKSCTNGVCQWPTRNITP